MEPGVFGSLEPELEPLEKKKQEPEPEPLGKKIRSWSRLKKKSGASSPALLGTVILDKKSSKKSKLDQIQSILRHFRPKTGTLAN